ncbi:MAG: sigma-54-dependent Fis family transcriptional regulator [Deltaproteobacteria bacterium]|nr:sigma-54-dependent Fis family transcriptional regulator [Deltaproteobacteria bacterium]
MRKKKILLVDDRINTLKVLMAILTDEGYEILRTTSGARALEIVREQKDIDLVLSDLKMPGMDGLALYRNMNSMGEAPPFIIMTAHGTVKSAVQALKEGITNYLIKPLDYEELGIVLERAIREREMSHKLISLQEQAFGDHSFHNMIGACPRMREIFDMIQTVGATDVSVLILGETGTGKELLARALHLESVRRDTHIVCINSAALTETLLEAELFGHLKGAFTGAVAEKKGRLEMAHMGTLFLDEIGHMSIGLQAKLLRFLEEMTFEPVGSATSRKVDVRIIAATNLDLHEEIKHGRFMRDLLYRIDVISIHVPPLRERLNDVPLLVDHFVKRYALQYKKVVEGVHPNLMETLMNYAWPGNIRELKNCLARAVILAKGPLLGMEDIPEKIVSESGRLLAKKPKKLIYDIPEQGVSIRDMERQLILKTLEQCRGNKSLAAQRLGISRKALYEKIARFEINAQQ